MSALSTRPARGASAPDPARPASGRALGRGAREARRGRRGGLGGRTHLDRAGGAYAPSALSASEGASLHDPWSVRQRTTV